MGWLSYFTPDYQQETHDNGFSTTKFVFVSLGISMVLFGVGYALRPISDIVDELHDSDSSDSSDSDSTSDSSESSDNSDSSDSSQK